MLTLACEQHIPRTHAEVSVLFKPVLSDSHFQLRFNFYIDPTVAYVFDESCILSHSRSSHASAPTFHLCDRSRTSGSVAMNTKIYEELNNS